MRIKARRYTPGKLIVEGKTKTVHADKDRLGEGIFTAKDDITAGDGAKRDIIKGKGVLANRTTCNVFRLLKASGVPVAFHEQITNVAFVAPICTMLPYEVIVRREAHGSYLKRMPHLSKGHHFERLVVEFFLKTSGRRWGEHELPCDDPLMIYREGAGKIELYDPKQPGAPEPFLMLDEGEVFSYPEEWKIFPDMERIARHTFLVLEKMWVLLDHRLVDFKIEFGFDVGGKLLVADVIDNDSWRVIDAEGRYVDKQYYRDDGSLRGTKKLYKRVADLTDRFGLPSQRVILWRGSKSDDITPAIEALYAGGVTNPVDVVCSIHKQPDRGLKVLRDLVHHTPDSVIIAVIGMSNGAGPTLSANTVAPVITVPASVKEFPDDVWSSLRMPSDVPVMTVLNQKNAALAALHILASRNPAIYAYTRSKIEDRLLESI